MADGFVSTTPAFRVAQIRRGKTIADKPAPDSPSSMRTIDHRNDEKAPSCVCNMPRVEPGVCMVIADCGVCRRTISIPLGPGQEAPGAVRVDCARRSASDS